MNWTAITADDLKAIAYGGIIDAANSQATGYNNPVAEAIADAVATVRGAISTGNVLDQDITKIPNSLRSLACRIAVFALMERLQIELTQDQRATRQSDQSRLNRITDQKLRFETADNAGGSGEMQPGANIQTVQSGNRGNDRETLRGL